MVSRYRTVALCVVAGTISLWLLAGTAQAAGTGTSISVSLSPTSILANGTSTSAATATVDDASSAGVAGDTVAFTSNDAGEKVSGTTDNGNGTYTATITSSTTVGTPTITATDSTSLVNSADLTASSQLTQTEPAPSGGNATISGTAQQGLTLTASSTGWTNSPTLSYTWESCSGTCTAVGTNSTTYAVAATDVGHTIEVVVLASNSGGSASVTSSPTATVIAAIAVNSALPAITGVAQQGQTLTASTGTWSNSPTSYTYQWENCTTTCATISGATAATYLVASTDVGKTIEVQVKAINTGGTSAAATSAATGVVVPPTPTLTGAPSITGTTVQGNVLTEKHGTWTNSPTSFTYQWLRCNSVGASCAAIAGATAQTYTLTAADVGGELVVGETASNGAVSAIAYSALSSVILSPALVVPVPVNSAPPTVSGVMQQGQTLVEKHGTWSENPGTFSYQWQRCGGGGCVAIPGANNQNYTLAGADVGQAVSVVETAANTGGAGAAVASIRTSVIIASSSITLAVAPNSAVTNQTVTLAATVTSGSGNADPAGSVMFSNGGVPIAGCANQNVNSGSQSVATICQASFGAGTHQLTVSYQPGAGSLVGASSSSVQTLVVGKVSTSVSLAVTKQVAVHKHATFVATVVPPAGNSGPMLPTGTVAFLDHGRQIAGCRSRPMKKGAATCMVKYAAVGSHRISARYQGDANFNGSTSAARTVLAGKNAAGPVVLGFINSTVQWKFYFHPKYTQILFLQASGVANASTLRLICHGTSCPFTTLSSTASAAAGCSGRGHVICSGGSGINLLPAFRNRHLSPGTQIVLWITRPNWIGKYYSFTVRGGQAPLIDLSCVAVGRSQPGVGC
jgi:Bacterial Ig-like domain (group 3)/Invasin, domain 3